MSGDLRTAQTARIGTTGRRTGRPHEVQVWFALEIGQDGWTLYAMSRHGTAGDWVANILADSRVQVRAGRTAYEGTARLVTDPVENERARRLEYEKYSPRHRGLEGWLDGPATVVAVDLPVPG